MDEELLRRRRCADGQHDGKGLAVSAAGPGQSPLATGWLTSSTEGVKRDVDVKTGQFLFNDVCTLWLETTKARGSLYIGSAVPKRVVQKRLARMGG